MCGSAAVPKNSASISEMKLSFCQKVFTLNLTPGFICVVPLTVIG
jgi:hypothetical protein